MIEDTTWRPTRTGTAFAIVGTLAVTVVLAQSLGLERPVVFAWVAAVPFAFGIWLTTLDSWRLPARYLAALAVLPLGAGIVVGTAYTGVTLFGALFPQPTSAGVAEATLVVLGRLAVVFGLTAAALGATASVADIVDGRRLRVFSNVAARTMLVALVAAGALVGLALVAHVEIGSLGQSIGDLVTEFTDATTTEFLSPDDATPHLFSFSALLVVASWLAARAIRTLPFSELLSGGARTTLIRTRRALTQVTLFAILLLLTGTVTQFAIPASTLRRVVPSTAWDTIVAVTTLSPLRFVLAAVAIGCLVVVVVAGLVRRLARASPGEFAVRNAPTVAGLTLVGGVTVVHGPLVRGTRSFLLSHTPYTFESIVRTQSSAVIDYWGTLPLAAAALAALLFAATVSLYLARIGIAFRLLPADTFGPALAAAGLFVAAAFAGPTDAVSTPLFLACIVVSLLVWDAGEYATRLGEEVGRHTGTASVEGVHAVGGVLVGAAASLVAVGAVTYADTISFSNPTTIPVAVVASAVAALALVFALR